MNPKYWENPSKFIPERFDKRVNEPVNPHSFVPFSFGQVFIDHLDFDFILFIPFFLILN